MMWTHSTHSHLTSCFRWCSGGYSHAESHAAPPLVPGAMWWSRSCSSRASGWHSVEHWSELQCKQDMRGNQLWLSLPETVRMLSMQDMVTVPGSCYWRDRLWVSPPPCNPAQRLKQTVDSFKKTYIKNEQSQKGWDGILRLKCNIT